MAADRVRQRSLEVFCVGILLSFVAHFILEMFVDGLLAQIAVSEAGLMIMTGGAFYRRWSRSLDRPVAAGKRGSGADD